MTAGTHRRAATEPTRDDLAAMKDRYRAAMLTEPTVYLPPAPRRRHRRGWPHLESFLIGVICGVVPMLLVLLYLTWKGLVTW